MGTDSKFTPENMNKFGASSLPGFLGIEITRVAESEVAARLEVKPHHLAPKTLKRQRLSETAVLEQGQQRADRVGP